MSSYSSSSMLPAVTRVNASLYGEYPTVTRVLSDGSSLTTLFTDVSAASDWANALNASLRVPLIAMYGIGTA